MFVGLVLAVLSSSCSSDPSPRSSPTKQKEGVGFHGFMAADITEEELTERADLVVRGEVLSREIGPLRREQPPPPISNEDQRSMVEGGSLQVKWRVVIDDWVKGDSPKEIVVVRGLGNGPVGFSDGSTQKTDEGLSPELAAVETGNKYTF